MEIRPHPITACGLVWFRASRPDIEQLRLAALGWYMVLMGAADAGVATAAAIPAATSAVAAASGG